MAYNSRRKLIPDTSPECRLDSYITFLCSSRDKVLIKEYIKSYNAEVYSNAHMLSMSSMIRKAIYNLMRENDIKKSIRF